MKDASPETDATRWQRVRELIADALPGDLAWLEAKVEPGWVARRRQLDERDAAIRSLRQFTSAPAAPTSAAKEIATSFNRYLAIGWIRDREAGLSDGATAVRRAHYAVAAANAGRPISWRQIFDILHGRRA